MMLHVFLIICALITNASSSQDLPIVDLGYQLQQASFYNESGKYYAFENIRYAAPPLGKLRWAAPAKPEVNRNNVQDGNFKRRCPQAEPAVQDIINLFLDVYLADPDGYNSTEFNATLEDAFGSSQPSAPDPGPDEDEDCLFLDVFVPASVFDQEKSCLKRAKVLTWIHGGGFTFGSKDDTFGADYWTSAGLLNASKQFDNEDAIILVSVNYRLGLFGWSSGPEFEMAGGVPNVGFHDQILAFKWIKQYITLFNGDPDEVTVAGTSAGGGSIMHLITAYGGEHESLFKRAIPQSPAYLPAKAEVEGSRRFRELLRLLEVSSLEEARRLPSEILLKANIAQIALGSTNGEYVYGPVVGGELVPALPVVLLKEGRFDDSIEIMSSYTTNEGLLYSDPFIDTEDQFRAFLEGLLDYASSQIIDFLQNDLYPPAFNGTNSYTDQISRRALVISDYLFWCNNYYLNKAYDNRTFTYIFDVPPALHGDDEVYVFYDGGQSGNVTNATIARQIQRYITDFTEKGHPTSFEGVEDFPIYGNDAQSILLSPDGITIIPDIAANKRCEWWQQALYF